MAVTSGFFNSVNGDRKYDAIQMGELFDGLINDGVYETIYNQFRVSAGEELSVQVDTGRGWFQHTWVKNDGIKIIQLPEAEVLFDRIDAIVIEINHNEAIRNNDIKYVKGIPSANPVRPVLKTGEEGVWQIPLAFVRINQGVESIGTADIANMVGTSECPFVTGVVSVMNIDMLIAQWGAQWNKWYKNNTQEFEETWRLWYQTNTTQFAYDFNVWFSQLQAMLEGDVALNLTNEILKLKNKFETLVKEHTLYDPLLDSEGDPILDSNENEIEGRTIFIAKGECDCLGGALNENNRLSSGN